MSEERMEESIEYKLLFFYNFLIQFFLTRRGKGWEVKENTYVKYICEQKFFIHILLHWFSYLLKTKANSSQSTSWCPLKMLLSRIAFSDGMLENRVYLTSTVSTSRANHSNVTSIHPSKSNIWCSVVLVIVMRTDEESRAYERSIVQHANADGPTLIKLSLYSFRSIL